MSAIKVYTDAGYDTLGLPPVYLGVAIEGIIAKCIEGSSDPKSLYTLCKSVTKPVRSSTEAEYFALLLALGMLLDMEVDKIHIVNDNQTMVRQMQGRYRVHKPYLQELKDMADKLWDSLKDQGKILRITHIPRKLNLADKCVREAKRDYLINQ